MRVCGVICEYNPFHKGHLYQIENIRKNGAEVIICVMSGNFTQRGDVAFADKYVRAKAAVLCGADLVLELPFPYSCASAEYFASAGVKILDLVGADTISFGSESSNLNVLEKAAKIAASDDFIKRCISDNNNARGSSAQYFEMLSNMCGIELSSLGSNDILAIEYLKAIIINKSKLTPFLVKREGILYRSEELEKDKMPSASALRRLIYLREYEKVEPFIPQKANAVYHDAFEAETVPVEIQNASDYVIGFFRSLALRRFDISSENIAELSVDLRNRICKNSLKASNIEELISMTATGKYTDSRIRRAILNTIIGVTKNDIKKAPAFSTLLAANQTGRNYLAKNRKNAALPILAKPSDYIKLGEKAMRQGELSARADAFFTMSLAKTIEAGAYFKKNAYIDNAKEGKKY